MAALSKPNIITDSSHVEVQNQLGKGLCALGKSISTVINNVDNILSEIKTDLLSCLWDSSKIFTNLFLRVSVTRKNIIIPVLKNIRDIGVHQLKIFLDHIYQNNYRL